MAVPVAAQILAPLLPWLILVGLISVLSTAFKTLVWPQLKGRLGEASINFKARLRLDPQIYHLIPNVMLPAPDGTTQVDHVIVSRYGIFVVETKTYKGWIFGGADDPQWTQMIYRRKQHFQNPLRQNYRHTRTLADLTGIPHEHMKPLVVFVGDSQFKTRMPDNVLHFRDFTNWIKSHQTTLIKDSQVPEIVQVIQEWAGTLTDQQRAQHRQNLRRAHQPVPADAQPPTCPRCGTGMVLRTRRRDGSQFWGCPRYPSCRGTRTAS